MILRKMATAATALHKCFLHVSGAETVSGVYTCVLVFSQRCFGHGNLCVLVPNI